MAKIKSSKVAEAQAVVDAGHAEREAGLKFGPKVKCKYVSDFPIADLTAPDGLNIRLMAGQVVGGVEVVSDRMAVSSMVAAVRHAGGITTPLVASKREDGLTVILQGNRRYQAALAIRAQSDADVKAQHRSDPEDLATDLATLPVMVYTGLTPDQERNLVNDQVSKGFTATEVYRAFVEQVQGGYSWQNAAVRLYQQVGRVTGAMDKVEQIDQMADPEAKRQAIIDWLTTTCQQYWMNSVNCGPRVAELTLKTFMFKDGMLPEKPEIMMDGGRVRKLMAAKKKDLKFDQWNQEKGTGKALELALTEFQSEDSTRKGPKGGKKPGVKFKAPSDFTALIETAKQTSGRKGGLVQKVLEVATKNGGSPDAIKQVHHFDRSMQVYKAQRDALPADSRDLLDLIFAEKPKAETEEQFTAALLAMVGKGAKPAPAKKAKGEKVNKGELVGAEA